MKKEIGGYFELEDFGGKEYYPNLYKVNLGRTALRWLLEGRGYTKIYLPVFLCESVTEACEQHGIRISRYQLDAELNVLLPRKKLGESECLYLVNYYGQLTDEKILAYQKIWKYHCGSYACFLSETAERCGYPVFLQKILGSQ